jgi:hypothetical protein
MVPFKKRASSTELATEDGIVSFCRHKVQAVIPVRLESTQSGSSQGRNHHSVGFGVISEIASGFVGYDSVISKDSSLDQKVAN